MDILSLDIGNGFGYVALASDAESDCVPMFPPETYLGTVGMPSTAYIEPPEGNTIVVYDRKRNQSVERLYSSNLIREAKMRIGQVPFALAGFQRSIPAEEVFAAIARDLIVLANEERRRQAKEPIYDVAFTFPASFADTNKPDIMQRSIEALVIDGHPIKVHYRLPEPAAVAVDYLYYMQHLAEPDKRIKTNRYTVLVYDLGHGTFDTAVVTADMGNPDKPYVLYSKSGMEKLNLAQQLDVGGRNFDWIIRDEILRHLQQHHIDITPKIQNDVLRRAVKIKHELTNQPTSSAFFDYGDEDFEVSVTREWFEQASADLIGRTIEVVEDLLRDAREAEIPINAIVLSGGAGQMPMVKAALMQVAGDIPIYPYRYSSAVAFGAARYAWWREQNNEGLKQLTDYAYGIQMDGPQTRPGRPSPMKIMIPKGTIRPATSQPIAYVAPENRPHICIYKTPNKENSTEWVDVENTDCRSVIRIPFDVVQGTRGELTLLLTEDYSIQVKLKTNETTITKKSTDTIEALIN